MNTCRKNLIITVLICSGLIVPAQAADLRIAAAANFASTLKKLLVLYEQQSGYNTVVSTGSTSKLYTQIINGAPFDIFLAADSWRPQQLESSNLALRGSRVTYARGRLVLWSASEMLRSADGFPDINNIEYLAIANPRLAPYGLAAQQTLESLGLWNAAQPKLVRGQSVSQAFQFVASGNATVGFISASQLPVGSGSHWLVPQHLYQPMEHQLVVLNGRPAAAGFAAFLQSAAARKLIQENGYTAPGEKD